MEQENGLFTSSKIIHLRCHMSRCAQMDVGEAEEISGIFRDRV